MWEALLVVVAAKTAFELNLQPGEAKLLTWAGQDWLRVYADVYAEANTTAQVEVVWLDLSQLHQLLAHARGGNYCCNEENCTKGRLDLPEELPEDQYLVRMFEQTTIVDFEVPPRARSIVLGGCASSNPLIQVWLELNSTATYLSSKHHPLLVVNSRQFHGVMTTAYATLLVLWIGRVLIYIQTAVGLQRWAIPIVLICCLGEQLGSFADWWEYEQGGHKLILLVLSALLGCGRVSLAYVVILVLSRGYGVLPSDHRGSFVHICLLGSALFLSHLLHAAVRYLSFHGKATLFLSQLSVVPMIVLHATFYLLAISYLKAVRKSLSTLQLPAYTRMYYILALAAALSVGWSVYEL